MADMRLPAVRTTSMHERFTDRARKVMQLANQAAQRFYDHNIDTEHILVALMVERKGVAAAVLKGLSVDLYMHLDERELADVQDLVE